MLDSTFTPSRHPRLLPLPLALLLLGAGSATQVAAQPSQTPLLASQSGAKPNLMISLDNSGSMAFNYHESYGINSDSQAKVDYGIVSAYGSWSSQRSADVNPVYYNPRVTYKPRVDASGAPLTPSDGVVFVSNQNSASFRYRVWRNAADEIRTTHSMYASNPDVTGYTSIYDISFALRTPQHITYTSTSAATPGFTYSYCSKVVTSTAGLQVGCASGQWTDVTILRGVSGDVTLPAGHNRTDCTGNVCTNSQEVANILNWYRYYAFRAPAVATAIGQALANSDYNKTLRLGYLTINRRNGGTVAAINQTPGVTTNNTNVLRGVRLHQLGGTDTQRLYSWLYDQDGTQNRNSNEATDPTFSATVNRRQAPYGGTPLHNVVERVSQYYRVATGARENPWSTNPAALASAGNPEMSCRRSFNLLFSDGAWNANTSTIAGQDFDNTNGPTFSRTKADGSTETFQYLRNGVNTVAGRKQYIPFPSTGTGGLADLTAQYFWHADLRTALANDIQTRAGQPTFWQNMTTYTVGYLIRPSGEIPGAASGLTFGQIDQYQAEYASGGYAAATKPTWATGDLNTGTDQRRVDDFIQAGYTGGGKGFSAQNADDVRNIFDTILSEILSASGKDAGVAVTTGTGDFSTIAGRLKYGVSYRTIDNSGDITAQELDAQGNVVNTRWFASALIPAPADRRVFTLSGTTSPTEFIGKFSSLPSDIQNALKQGPFSDRVANDESFINYLRGLDPVADAQGKLFRQRSSPLGAMVNPPSIFMGGERDFAYDLAGSVDGATSYLDYATKKQKFPASLFVATNAGMVHTLDAEAGKELAAFMPRRSLKRMLDYANPSYVFQYTLDGPLSEHDIYSAAGWNHLAVGTGGRGERLIYALRSPLKGALPLANRTPDLSDFLWETGPDIVDTAAVAMGHITNPARSGQTEGGDWVVVANNGHYNGRVDGSGAGLFVLNPMTGALIRSIPLPAGYSAGRGLSGVTLVRNADKRIVAAYAGDANGNLWRFNLKGSPATWDVSYGKPVFTTANNRPIYGSPAWQPHPKGGAIVVVATGILLEDDDLGDTANRESIYGIWDPTPVGDNDKLPFTTVTTGQLLSQSVIAGSAQTVAGVTGFTATKNVIDWEVHRGWTMTLGNTFLGERSIDQIRNLGSSVIIATTVLNRPADPDAEMCSASALPANYIYILNALDGATKKSFDLDNDGKLDNVSVVLVTGGGYSRGMAVANIIKKGGITDAIRSRLSADTNAGESDPKVQKCSPVSARLLGTEQGSFAAGVACEVPGWSRSQYQLGRPPAN